MDSFNPTTKTQAALTAALQAASAAGNPEIRPAHLLVALLDQTDGIAAPLLKAVGTDPATVRREAQDIVDRLPRASGATTTPTSGARRWPRSPRRSDWPPRWATNMSPPNTSWSAWPPGIRTCRNYC